MGPIGYGPLGGNLDWPAPVRIAPLQWGCKIGEWKRKLDVMTTGLT